jgi:tetratricopeptide (TPR) repeat protein
MLNNPADIFETRKEYVHKHGPINGYATLFNAFYSPWLEYIENFGGTIVKYEDILDRTFSGLAPLADGYQPISPGELLVDIPKVPNSVEFSEDELARHRRLECHVPLSVALEFWKAIDENLTQRFHYMAQDVAFDADVGVRILAYRLLSQPLSLTSEDFSRILSEATGMFVNNCAILHASGREVIRRDGNLPKALELYEAALLATKFERRIYGVYSDLNALVLIDDIRAVHSKIGASESDTFSTIYDDEYHKILENLIVEVDQLTEDDMKFGVSAMVRCRNLVHFSDLLLRAGRLDEAEMALNQAVCLDCDSALAHTSLAELLNGQGRAKDAEPILRVAINRDPRRPSLRWALSDVLSRLGRLTEAFDEASAAIELDDPEPGRLHHYARLAFDLGRLEDAEVALRRAIQMSPHDGDLHFSLSEVLERQGRADEALKEAAAAIERPGADPWRFHHHACLALNLGRLEEALASLKHALLREPDNRNHLFVLADILKRQGRLQSAEDALRRAVRAHPRDGALHFARSGVLNRLGRLTEAFDEASAAIELDDPEPGRLHHYGSLALRMGKLDAAEESLGRAIKADPDNPGHLLMLGKVLLKSNRPNEAKAMLLRAKRLGPGRFHMRLHLVLIQAQLRQMSLPGQFARYLNSNLRRNVGE